MNIIGEFLKKLKEAKNMEVSENESVRIRLTISSGKVEIVSETIPDLDALSLEQLYALQAEYEDRVDAMSEAEPDAEEDPNAYEQWQEQLDLLEEDLEEVNDKIDELEETDD